LAKRLGISGRVIFRPPVADVGPLLRDADFYVSTSLFEGMSNALLESMAYGVPGVVSRVSGVDDIVVDGRSGLVFEPGDDEGYLRTLHRAVAMPRNEWRAVAEEAMKTVRAKCGIDKIAKQYVDVYGRLIAGAMAQSESR
jgi:glycosyltransferase involved in cell wall biosynthesis